MFEFYIDDVLITDQPLEWRDLSGEISFDKELNGVFVSYPTTLTFTGDGYQTLKDKFNDSGFCSNVELKVKKHGIDFITGSIFISDCEFNIHKYTAKVEIIDKGFFARLKNNLKIKANVGSDQSKNSTALNQISVTTPTQLSIDFKMWDGASTITDPVHCYDVKEVLQFLVEFMSDGEITFASDWYDGLDSNEHLLICTGNAIRQTTASTTDAPELSFYELFADLNRAYQLCLVPILNSDGTYTLRVEELAYLNGLANIDGIEIENPRDITVSIDTDELPAIIKLGSTKTNKSGGTYGQQPIVEFLGTQVEEYHVQGECNIDKTLDLSLQTFNVDHNNIYDIMINASTSYDDDIFLVNYIQGSSVVRRTDPFGTGNNYIINETFFNNKIAERYSLQGAIAKFIADYDGRFDATSLTPLTTSIATPPLVVQTSNVVPLSYEVENFDFSASYDPVTYRYTCPSTGLYSFYASFNQSWSPGSSADYTAFPLETGAQYIEITIDLVHYDSGLVEQARVSKSYTWEEIKLYGANDNTIDFTAITRGGSFTAEVSGAFSLSATDIVQAEATISFRIATEGDTILTNFKCDYSFDGGGVYEVSSLPDYRKNIVRFNHFLTDEQINTLKDSGHIPIRVTDGDFNHVCYAKAVNINFATNLCTFELRANIDEL